MITLIQGPLAYHIESNICYFKGFGRENYSTDELPIISETINHVMKVTDYERAHGAIIGKAMTSLDKGEGLVLVLVNLQ